MQLEIDNADLVDRILPKKERLRIREKKSSWTTGLAAAIMEEKKGRRREAAGWIIG